MIKTDIESPSKKLDWKRRTLEVEQRGSVVSTPGLVPGD
jgi:hypothetical protein